MPDQTDPLLRPFLCNLRAAFTRNRFEFPLIKATFVSLSHRFPDRFCRFVPLDSFLFLFSPFFFLSLSNPSPPLFPFVSSLVPRPTSHSKQQIFYQKTGENVSIVDDQLQQLWKPFSNSFRRSPWSCFARNAARFTISSRAESLLRAARKPTNDSLLRIVFARLFRRR